MIKVNTKTLVASREAIPQSLQGLSIETLSNLQTELNPVPKEFKDIEFWQETDTTPTFDSSTHTYDGSEELIVDVVTKVVNVTKGIRLKTQAELDAERKALVPQSITKIQAMRVMKANGLWAAFNTALASNQDALDEWNLSTELRRDNVFVLMFAPILELTEEQLDEMFINASKL